MSTQKKVVFPEHVMQRIREFVDTAPPLTPDQQAVIRGACARPYPPPKKADKAA